MNMKLKLFISPVLLTLFIGLIANSAISAPKDFEAAFVGNAPSGLLTGSFFSGNDGAANAKFTVRDSVTGKRISARIAAVSQYGSAALFGTDQTGRGSYRLGEGRVYLTITAEGYQAIDTYLVTGQIPLDTIIWLDPEEVPAAMRSESVEAELKAGQTLVHGNISDEQTGKTLAGARVFFEGQAEYAVADADGYFKLYVQTPPVDPAGDLPGTGNLIVEFRGKTVYRRTNQMIPAGAVQLIIDVEPGAATEKDATHKMRLTPDEQKNTQTTPPAESDNLIARPAAVSVPANIRVGSTCPTKTTCSVINVYTLDTYTRLGLDDEWISSWNANSLKAGAIAFRTYGAYHVVRPLTANYDICNTTSCQVVDPADSATSTNNATAQTTGSIVVNAARNDIFFAEYSAENNLGGCPDGFTGNNALWPCLADPVDAGTTFNGHGRGMCQWGSQRWSINQGKDFVWIVEHYYNGNGNPSLSRNGFLQLSPDTLLPPPNLAEPGVTTAPGPTISSLTPTFQWEPMAGADGYSLYISKLNGSTYDLVFNSETAVGQPLTGTSYTLPDGVLQANAAYRWNMSSHIAAGYGTANTFRNYFSVGSIAASVSGRVLTPDGRAVRNAVVSLIDAQNLRFNATTSSFGLYSFAGITPGQSYTITVASKRYRFAPQVLQINGSLANVDFVGQE